MPRSGSTISRAAASAARRTTATSCPSGSAAPSGASGCTRACRTTTTGAGDGSGTAGRSRPGSSSARTSPACPTTACFGSTRTRSKRARRSGPSRTCLSRGLCRTGTSWAASPSTRTSRHRSRSSSSGCPKCRSRACGSRSRGSPASSTRSTRAPRTSFASSARTARADLRPRLSRPIPLAGYATVTPFAGGRVTAYDRTVTSTGFKQGVFIGHTDDRERVRQLAEFGSDLESRAARVYQLRGAGGLDALLHTIEPRVHYIRVLGKNFYSLPIWTERIDNVPEASWLEYSITNRVRGRTVSPEGTEAVRQELLRFTAAHAYDIEGKRWGNLAGDLSIQPTKVLRFRGDVSYNVEHGIFQAGTTDVEVTLPFATANVGTRFDRRVPFVPDWAEIPGTYNPGLAIPERASVNFLQGGVSSEVRRNLILRASTNYDARTDTFVESRFGVDLKFQCWALVLEYINRSPEFGGKTADNEFRFTLNLLGVGGVLSTRLGASESGARLK